MRRRWLLAAVALVVVANAVVLARAAYNRSGTPDATLRLTERELPWGWQGPARNENSGWSLRLRYRRFDLAWLDASKLRELGFDPDAPREEGGDGPARFRREPLPRRAFVVLEYDGPAWAALVKEQQERVGTLPDSVAAGTATRQSLEDARRQLEWMRTAESRLVPVDAGTDRRELRVRYPDRSRYLIAAAELRMYLARHREKGEDSVSVRGGIDDLVANPIHLPARFHRALAEATGGPAATPAYTRGRFGSQKPQPPRYEVTIRYGRSLAPWVVALQPTGDGERGP